MTNATGLLSPHSPALFKPSAAPKLTDEQIAKNIELARKKLDDKNKTDEDESFSQDEVLLEYLDSGK